MTHPTEIVIGLDGDCQSIYGEAFDYACLGSVNIRRASFVEPDEAGRWWADMFPLLGPRLGPFAKRSEALDAELSWLGVHALQSSEPQPKEP